MGTLTIVEKIVLMDHLRCGISKYNGVIIRLENESNGLGNDIRLHNRVKIMRERYKALRLSIAN